MTVPVRVLLFLTAITSPSEKSEQKTQFGASVTGMGVTLATFIVA